MSQINAVLQSHYGSAQAGLLRRLQSLELAEDAMQEACLRALRSWPKNGIPANVTAWLITCGYNATIDKYRRDKRLVALAEDSSAASVANLFAGRSEAGIDDDILNLIFLCCHPAIAVENQLALTLKMVMGFTQAEVAHALLVTEKTLEQRLTRAKRKIVAAGISFELSSTANLEMRVASVTQALYLIFNEGYYASTGEQLLNSQLCKQAVLMTRSLCRRFPSAESLGLLSLMLFQSARERARTGDSGELITLDRQDRSRWNRQQIEEADVLLQKALRQADLGVYQLQAAIAGVHSLAASAQETDWLEIVGLYARLLRIQPSPVIRLNHAVALMMAGEVQAAGIHFEALEPTLSAYSPYYAALARFHEYSGDAAAAATALENAQRLSGSEQERRHYQLQHIRLREEGAE